jgi:hypothetical protein
MYVHDDVTAEALMSASRVLGLQGSGVLGSLPGTQTNKPKLFTFKNINIF